MDPLDGVDIDKDTSFALALEAQRLGHELWFVSDDALMINKRVPQCVARKILFLAESPCFKWMDESEMCCLDDFDFILLRKDPPFDEKYFFATHILSLCRSAKVVNRPASLRNAPEKLYALSFPEINPPTLISSNAEQILDFQVSVGGNIIIKPLNKCGGSGIVFLQQGDKNFNSIIELSTNEGKDYIVAQKYLPEIANGDKRVICINGKAVGAISRIPGENEHRGNIHVGGIVKATEITKRDLWLVEQVESRFREEGLFFVGLDIIGDYITEINVTSPTGVQEIKRLCGIDVAKIFFERLTEFI